MAEALQSNVVSYGSLKFDFSKQTGRGDAPWALSDAIGPFQSDDLVLPPGLSIPRDLKKALRKLTPANKAVCVGFLASAEQAGMAKHVRFEEITCYPIPVFHATDAGDASKFQQLPGYPHLRCQRLEEIKMLIPFVCEGQSLNKAAEQLDKAAPYDVISFLLHIQRLHPFYDSLAKKPFPIPLCVICGVQMSF